MPQSLASVLIHLVFSTKHRRPFITPIIETELHKYMSTVFRGCDSPALLVGGYEDHIHALFSLSRKWTIADVVEEVKTSSSSSAARLPFRRASGLFSTARGRRPGESALRLRSEKRDHSQPSPDQVSSAVQAGSACVLSATT